MQEHNWRPKTGIQISSLMKLADNIYTCTQIFQTKSEWEPVRRWSIIHTPYMWAVPDDFLPKSAVTKGRKKQE